MPEAPLKQCARCRRVLTRERYCPECAEIKKREYQSNRNKSWQHLYGAKWRKAREFYLIKHPFCVECEKDSGRLVRADVLDHIVPHKGDVKKFWDRSNWQGLCTRHHNKKTANEGAFGRNILS